MTRPLLSNTNPTFSHDSEVIVTYSRLQAYRFTLHILATWLWSSAYGRCCYSSCYVRSHAQRIACLLLTLPSSSNQCSTRGAPKYPRCRPRSFRAAAISFHILTKSSIIVAVRPHLLRQTIVLATLPFRPARRRHRVTVCSGRAPPTCYQSAGTGCRSK